MIRIECKRRISMGANSFPERRDGQKKEEK
jgi:hypothetical protein